MHVKCCPGTENMVFRTVDNHILTPFDSDLFSGVSFTCLTDGCLRLLSIPFFSPVIHASVMDGSCCTDGFGGSMALAFPPDEAEEGDFGNLGFYFRASGRAKRGVAIRLSRRALVKPIFLLRATKAGSR